LPSVRTLGLVVREVDVLETSSVVTVFTRELGKVGALAKGARRLKSPLQGGLDLLSVSDIVVLHKATDALDLVTEAVLVERFESLRRDLAALYAGYYIAELLSELTDLNDPHPKLFDAATITLRHLGDPVLRSRRLLRFEMAALRALGHMPALDTCAHCGAAVMAGRDKNADEELDAATEAVAFGLATGGVLCPECRPGQPHVATLSQRTLGAIRTLAAPGGSWRDIDASAAALAPVRATLGHVISHLMGRRPRLLPYLGV
jgi:DNA repair protein RecO (recombination protein O)